MKTIKKATAVILSLIMVAALFVPTFYAATGPTITDIEITRLPVKTVLYQNEDWVYGTWDADDSSPTNPVLIPSEKISFTHNPCGGIYPERGMLDMTGLVIKVYYSDGSTVDMEYKETKAKTGYYKANILVSPKGGVSYFIGTNTMEVYLAENKYCYDSFDVEFAVEKPEPEPSYFGVKEGGTAIIDKNGYIMGLKTALTAKELFNDFLEYGNVEVSVAKAQSSAKYLGTGSTVTVKYPDGQEETYTIVIYGDVDGNSLIDSIDIATVSNEVAIGGILNAVQTKAANVDGMRHVTTTDIALLSSVFATGVLNQVNPLESL